MPGDRLQNALHRYLTPGGYTDEAKKNYARYSQAYTDANSGDTQSQSPDVVQRRLKNNPAMLNEGRRLEFLASQSEYDKSRKLYDDYEKARKAYAGDSRTQALPTPAAPAAPATAPGAVNAAGYRQPFAAPKYTRQTLQ
jgi:hypothetical protein